MINNLFLLQMEDLDLYILKVINITMIYQQ